MRVIEKEENINLPEMEVLPDPNAILEELPLHHNPAKGEEGIPYVPPSTPQSPYQTPISINRSMTRDEIS